MVREAEIKISSVIENLDGAGLPEGEPERTEGVYSGYYHIIDGEYFLTYSETSDGVETVSEIRYSGACVRVTRRGGVESELVFSEGKVHTSLYRVPPYTFESEVVCRRIRAALCEEGGTLDLHYNMKIGGAEKSARMKIWISTNSRQG